TVQGGDVLERHENVAVQLDVGDVLDVAVRRQDTLLVLAPEEGDLDLLALVLVGVVLHRGTQSIGAGFPSPAANPALSRRFSRCLKSPPRVLAVGKAR